MTTLASTRTALTSRQRKEKNPVLKDGLGAVKKLMEIHADPEAGADRKGRAAQYLVWQTERLLALTSAPHGEC
jgi:hypothetical protein